MKAIAIAEPGGPDKLVLCEREDPVSGPGEVRVKVVAAGINRPDVLQRKGLYEPPKGTTPLPGLEVAGTIDQLGAEVTGWSIGDRVCALVGGGGYAELCVVPEGQCLAIPDSVSFIEAGALPETWFTVWANVFEHGGLKPGEVLLVHGGSSGIGHTAIQLAKARGAQVITTSSQKEKARFCEQMGADMALVYSEQDFVAESRAFTGGRGVDVVLDMVGGGYLAQNIDALGFRGRHVSIAFLQGSKAELSIAKVMAKQAVVTGSYLRSRPKEEKTRLTERVRSELWPLLEQGRARPHVDRSFPLEQAPEAHRVMESGAFMGKIVLEI